MIDRRRRPFDTRFFMTIAKGNVPSERNGLKSGRASASTGPHFSYQVDMARREGKQSMKS
jgi:hypothetical protein